MMAVSNTGGFEFKYPGWMSYLDAAPLEQEVSEHEIPEWTWGIFRW